jgi:hypothetical protein
MPWTNESGLKIRFGTELASLGKGGQYRWNGPVAEYEYDIIGTQLNAFGTVTFLSDTVRIPDGMLLTDATIEVTQPFTSGGSATLTLGFHNEDGTAYDADGIDATVALTALDAVGETTVCDGALVNTLLQNPSYKYSYVTATVGTANYTAGKAKLRLRLFVPDGGTKAPLHP